MWSTVTPQITILYAIDGQEMDHYLSEEMANIIEYPLSISHKRIEDIEHNFDNIYENILKSNAIIMVLSKEFLNIISILSSTVFQLTRLLNPSKTVLMFFGCRESDMSPLHRSLLYGYGRCHRVVATQTHIKQFVINTIKLLQNILDLNEYNKIFIKKRNRFSNTPQFELSVDRVFQVGFKVFHFYLMIKKINFFSCFTNLKANQKIYILLDSAISETQRIHLSIGVSNDILIAHWKNPYTLYFTLPGILSEISIFLFSFCFDLFSFEEFMISYNESLEISLICGHKHLGTRNIQCVAYPPEQIKTNLDSLDDSLNNELLMSSMNTVFSDESLPEIPLKNRYKKNPDMKQRKASKIYLNAEDFYITPDTDAFNRKTG